MKLSDATLAALRRHYDEMEAGRSLSTETPCPDCARPIAIEWEIENTETEKTFWYSARCACGRSFEVSPPRQIRNRRR